MQERVENRLAKSGEQIASLKLQVSPRITPPFLLEVFSLLSKYREPTFSHLSLIVISDHHGVGGSSHHGFQHPSILLNRPLPLFPGKRATVLRCVGPFVRRIGMLSPRLDRCHFIMVFAWALSCRILHGNFQYSRWRNASHMLSQVRNTCI
jgi:hypothetical protein